MAKQKKEQQMREFNYEDFNLDKFKLVNDGKIKSEIEYSISGTTINSRTDKSEALPHEDLKQAISGLTYILANRMGLLHVVDIMIFETEKGDLERLEKLHEIKKKQIERAKPSGIKVSGDGAMRGMVITGSITVPNGGSYSFGCPRILTSLEKLGYEQELEDQYEKIREEVYLMLFRDKAAKDPKDDQTSIPMD